MRVHVVSDVHGNVEGLRRACEGADTLLILGDLLDLIDYHDHAGGILGTLFGAERVGRFVELRGARDRGPAYHYLHGLWASLDDPVGLLSEVIAARYAALFDVLSVPTVLTPGNIDAPEVLAGFAGNGLSVLDGAAVDVGGLRFGFVGGVPVPGAPFTGGQQAWRSYLRDPDEFGRVLDGLGRVDVYCTHAPPALAQLTYDVRARRHESGSSDLLAAIRRVRPRLSLFGHIHQPLARRARVQHTECVNVGHFQRRPVPFVLRW